MSIGSGAVVHEFPDRASRSWRWIREAFNDHYRSAGWPQAAVDRMLETLSSIYAVSRDGPSMSEVQAMATPEEGVQAINRWVSEIVLRLLAEIADRELRLVNAEIDQPTGPAAG